MVNLEEHILETFILVLMKCSTKSHGNNLEDIDQNYYCSNHYDVSVNKYGVKCGGSLRFLENKEWMNQIDPYGWSSCWLKDHKMI